jgi:hypothetical protein
LRGFGDVIRTGLAAEVGALGNVLLIMRGPEPSPGGEIKENSTVLVSAQNKDIPVRRIDSFARAVGFIRSDGGIR